MINRFCLLLVFYVEVTAKSLRFICEEIYSSLNWRVFVDTVKFGIVDVLGL